MQLLPATHPLLPRKYSCCARTFPQHSSFNLTLSSPLLIFSCHFWMLLPRLSFFFLSFFCFLIVSVSSSFLFIVNWKKWLTGARSLIQHATSTFRYHFRCTINRIWFMIVLQISNSPFLSSLYQSLFHTTNQESQREKNVWTNSRKR